MSSPSCSSAKSTRWMLSSQVTILARWRRSMMSSATRWWRLERSSRAGLSVSSVASSTSTQTRASAARGSRRPRRPFGRRPCPRASRYGRSAAGRLRLRPHRAAWHASRRPRPRMPSPCPRWSHVAGSAAPLGTRSRPRRRPESVRAGYPPCRAVRWPVPERRGHSRRDGPEVPTARPATHLRLRPDVVAESSVSEVIRHDAEASRRPGRSASASPRPWRSRRRVRSAHTAASAA